MLYAETPEVKLLKLEAWLEKQPADREYCGHDAKTCLFAQYLGHEARVWDIIPEFGEKGLHIALGGECTFGAALKRCRKVNSSGWLGWFR